MTIESHEAALSRLAETNESAAWAVAEIRKLRAALLGLDSAASQGFMRAKPLGPVAKAAPKQFG